MDLSPYTCRGLPGEFDCAMRDVPVAGIDRAQAHAMVRLCDETESILYGPYFSPRRIRFVRGSRPRLREIVKSFDGYAANAMAWVRQHIRHPNFVGHVAPDRAFSEEQLIDSGVGWCNEQCRVFIALCEVMQIPARLCFLFHANGKTSHTAAEAWLGNRWALFDVTFGVRIQLPNCLFAEGRDLRGQHRELAHRAYRCPLTEYYRGRQCPLDVTRGGDFFETLAICNYLIEGVEVARET